LTTRYCRHDQPIFSTVDEHSLSMTKNIMLEVNVAALQLNVHRDTILKFVRNGTLPATKFGSSWAIHPDDLSALRVRYERGDYDGRCNASERGRGE
jgi:excisionase family DNA binding protein